MDTPPLPRPPPPQPPEPPPKPRGSFWIYAAALFALAAISGLTVAIMGSIWPLLIGFGALAIIALQYVIWGRLFERIYRPEGEQTLDDRNEMQTEWTFQTVRIAILRFRFFLARIASFVAIIYGAITFNGYFFFLGIAAVLLFWLWDRMNNAEDNTPGPTITDGPNPN